MSALAFGASLVGSLADRILSLPPWLVVGFVFLIPALEASAFVGFVFPGEIAVILGGVVASRGRVSLAAVVIAAASGAIIGDSVGYFIGRRWGPRLLRGTIGRLPIIRKHLEEHLDSARAFVRRRKGSAVFFGRFTAALRVLVPGLAGMSEVHYPSFLVYNVAGGVVWGTGFALIGYAAGASYKHVERIASRAGLILLALFVAGLLLSRLFRRLRAHSARLAAFGGRLAALPPMRWVRSRFPRQVAWVRARLDASDPRGFLLTLTFAVGALAAWAFGALTQDVIGHDETALLDPRVTRWAVAHRMDWLTGAMKVVTWLGSNAVIVPLLLVIAIILVVRRRAWRAVGLLILAVAGATGLSNVVKVAVGRSRPPVALWIGHYAGAAFPSGHATQAIAFYGMLAIVFSAGRSPSVRLALWTGAMVVVLVVGASRVYLGAHWMGDVLGGYALGAAWISLIVVMDLLTARGGGGWAASADEEALPGRRRSNRRAAA